MTDDLSQQLGRIEAKIDSNRIEMARLAGELIRDKETADRRNDRLDERMKVVEQELTRQKTITVVISGVVSFFILVAGSLVHLFDRIIGIK